MARRDPPPQSENASWSETLLIMWVVFQTLAVPLAFLMGSVGLLMWFVLALFSNVWMALVPLAIGGLVIGWFVRRDRQAARIMEAERDGLGGPRPPGPRRPGL